MRPIHRWLLYALFAGSGFSALCLQVIWQRVLTLHAGVDLFSVTTVVAAFMAGLGLGSLLGGVWADRLSPRSTLLAFAGSKLGVALYAVGSLSLLNDGYRAVVPHFSGMFVSFLFHFVLLVIPTTLMGLSLPLLARGVVQGAGDIAPRVSRLYATNTLGAAAGAALTAYWLLGSFGFVGAVRIAAAISLLTGLGVFALWTATAQASVEQETKPAPLTSERSSTVYGWMALYAVTGAAAIGLEVLYFRLVDVIIRSNSYTFGHVLALYLFLLGAGVALTSRVAGRTQRPEVWFLWIQFGIGLVSLLGLAALVFLSELPKLGPFVTEYFQSHGFVHGPKTQGDGRTFGRFVFAHFIAPLLVMGIPVVLMGAAFPFIQAVVARSVDTLGRRTGALLAWNIVGNVLGSVLTGFLLLDRLGTVGTLLFWCIGLGLLGLVAAWREPAPLERLVYVFAAVGPFALALVMVPSGPRLWSFLHGTDPSQLSLAEDRACVNALVHNGQAAQLYINGADQNGYPYDDYHVLIGLLPSLMHPNPERSLAVGLGAGGTAYGLLMHPRVKAVRCVEICGGEIKLVDVLAQRESRPSQTLLRDPRSRLEVGDGRKALLRGKEPLQVVTVDTLRPTSAYSGNLYSVEFYELVKSRLAPDGLFAQWVATGRVLHTVKKVFPHVLVFEVPSYLHSTFFVASPSPIDFNRDQLIRRLAELDLKQTLPRQAESLTQFIRTAVPQSGHGQAAVTDEQLINRDLFPRDEYFLQSN
jgi:spermidine synthase